MLDNSARTGGEGRLRSHLVIVTLKSSPDTNPLCLIQSGPNAQVCKASKGQGIYRGYHTI